MKVIFIQNIGPYIKKGQIKKIANGYARNYLFPKKLAIPYSNYEEKKLLLKEEKSTKENKKSINQEFYTKLNGKLISFNAKASADGTLYAGIKKEDLVNKIKEIYKIELNKDFILLEKPIKSIGQYNVKIRYNQKQEGNIIIEVKKI